MTDHTTSPGSAEEAQQRGYEVVDNLERYLGSRKVDKSQFSAAPGGLADCQVSPPGAKCFEFTYPDGSHVVGFCDGNGICKLYARKRPRSDPPD